MAASVTVLSVSGWRLSRTRIEDFDGDVIRVVTLRSASSGSVFGSSTMIVSVSGRADTTKGTGVGSTERIFKSGECALALALAAWLTPSPTPARHHNAMAIQRACVAV